MIAKRILVLTTINIFAAAPFASAQLRACYSSDGGLTFENVDDLVGLRINSSTGVLIAGNATDLDGAATGTFGVVNDQAPDFIEWGNLLGMTFDSAFAGNVLPAGLSQAELSADFEVLYRGVSSPALDRAPLDVLICIPEPANLVAACIALLSLFPYRARPCNAWQCG